MKKRQFYGLVMTILIVSQLVSITLAYAEWKETEISRKVSLPRKITISPPSPDLPKEIAGFSGRWEGIWVANSVPSILIVEKIDLKEAQVISAWGLSLYFKPDYDRCKAKVIGKEIQFTSMGCQFKFVMGEDLETIKGVRECPGRGISSSITMKKIE
jgi:hypothetical protein